MTGGEAGQDVAGEAAPTFDPAPLILTLELAEADQARFDRLRAAHFPPERNWLAAHVTLFHHLPPDAAAPLAAELAALAAATPAFTVAVTGPRSLGRGTAFALESAALSALRASLAGRWGHRLTPQDRQGFRPHVTVQNKVSAAEARALLAALRAAFVPFTVAATGLLLWRYRGGPWEGAGRFAFAG